MPVSAKIASRISSELRRYQGILTNAKQRDVNESDTVVIITDMLSDIFGYDKFLHVTTEHAIRGSFVDLAVIVDEEVRFLIEAKSIGSDLKDTHVKQAVDYAANKGTELVLLTNGNIWRAYKIHFTQPIEKSLVFEIDVIAADPKSEGLIECFGNLCREGFSQESMSQLLEQRQVTSKFAIAALLLSDAILDELRSEIRKISGLRVDTDYLHELLEHEVIKRELIDGDEATEASSVIRKLQRSVAREKKKRAGRSESEGQSATQNTGKDQEIAPQETTQQQATPPIEPAAADAQAVTPHAVLPSPAVPVSLAEAAKAIMAELSSDSSLPSPPATAGT